MGAYSSAYSSAFDTQATPSTGGYSQLLSIYREAEAEYAARKAVNPQSCPNDGTPLEPAPDGSLFCRFDGVSWPRDRALFESANYP